MKTLPLGLRFLPCLAGSLAMTGACTGDAPSGALGDVPVTQDVLLPTDSPREDRTPGNDAPDLPPQDTSGWDPADAPGTRDAATGDRQDPGEDEDLPPRDPGACPEGEGCEPPDPCGRGFFQVTSLELMGQSFQAETKAGSSLLAVWRWTLANPPDCPDCQRPLVLGVERTPTTCVMATAVALCPSLAEGESLGTLRAPGDPGTYTVFAAAPLVRDCDEARAAFPEDPSRVPIGMVRVPGDCPPDTCPAQPCEPTDCLALDRRCGTWGDGCRHPLDCGACDDGETCTLQGRCEGPCTHGTLDVTRMRLAGSGPVASIRQGDPAHLVLGLRVANPPSCPDCPRFAALGWDQAEPECVDLDGVPLCPEAVEVSLDRLLPPPGTPGQHALLLAAPPEARDCPSALEAFGRPSRRLLLGTLQVHPDCSPVSCAGRGRECGPADDGCGLQLSCGNCPPGDLCSPDGRCGCDGSDPYEPNDSPATAHVLESATDSDAASRRTLRGSLSGHPDWFRIDATDVPLAIVDPFVRLRPDLPATATLTVAYACRNGNPASLVAKDDSDCRLPETLDLGSGLPAVPGIRCPLGPAATTIHFEPTCPGGADDSGTLYVGLSPGPPCTAFSMELHL